MLSGGGGGPLEASEMTQARIQTPVNENPVLLFMKGSKNFPQCGFSDTATKILEAYNINQVSCSGCTQ
jgi:glutaredoxin-related protein